MSPVFLKKGSLASNLLLTVLCGLSFLLLKQTNPALAETALSDKSNCPLNIEQQINCRELIYQLDLSGEQKKQIDELYANNDKNLTELNKQLTAKQAEANTLMKSKEYKEEQLQTVQEEISYLEKNINRLKNQTHNSVKSLLSPEQLLELRNKRFQ